VNFQEATINFIMSGCLSVCLSARINSPSRKRIFSILEYFSKICQGSLFEYNLIGLTGTLHEKLCVCVCVCDNISLKSSLNEMFLIVVEKIKKKTFCV
jgi:hypothetical protein